MFTNKPEINNGAQNANLEQNDHDKKAFVGDHSGVDSSDDSMAFSQFLIGIG